MLLDAENALQKLKDGNAAYVATDRNTGDISHIIREETCAHGQAPYAVVVACSDSRVIPEVIFNAGIGELFDIRVAGNVIGANQLGSIEYAVGHLGTRLVVVLGHDHCGAVGAALEGAGGGSIDAITGEILRAIGGETDEDAACLLNVKNSVRVIREQMALPAAAAADVRVVGARYHIASGRVDFLD